MSPPLNLPKLPSCPVCGSCLFSSTTVLWSELILQWQISEYEVEYINLQQGYHCNCCGSNLRSMALANALLTECGIKKTLIDAINSGDLNEYNVLEINEAGHLTKHLAKISKYKYIQYPDYDMTNLMLGDNQFDIVIHSDTLEHIENPICALSECRRVLTNNGRCYFTVPTIVDRFTRSRNGMSSSYHGNPENSEQGMLVHTEFGVDVWKYPLIAGFTSIGIYSLHYPAGLAYVGRK